MPITLESIPATKIILPPRIVLYGPEKIGKSTFASDLDGALYFDVEKGSGVVNVRRAKEEWKASFPAVLDTVKALRTQQHDYTGVVIDTADWLEMLIFKQVAAEHGKKAIDEIGYGAGYNAAVNLWKQLLDELTGLTEKGMPVLVLAHSMVKRYDNPMTESYDRYQLKLHQKTGALLTEWCDALLFADQRVYVDKKDVGFRKIVTKGRGGDVVLHTVGSPAFAAGNRYGLPAELDFTWASFIDAFNAAITEPAASAAA